MKTIFRLLLVALFSASLPTSLLATNHYVSPAGDDQANDGSAASPWRHIAFAVDHAQTGDVLHILGDGDADSVDYQESVTIPVSLPAVTLQGEDSAGDMPRWRAPDQQSALTVSATDVVISGIEFAGLNPSEGIVLTATAQYALIEACQFPLVNGEKLWRAITLEQGSTDHTIDGCTFSDQSYGIWAEWEQAAYAGLAVSGNQFTNVTGAIEMHNVTHCRFEENVWQGGAHGVKCLACPDLLFADNQVDTNTNGLYVTQADRVRVHNNTFEGPGITLSGAHHGLVQNNTLTNCATAIDLSSSSHAAIIANELSGGSTGLAATGSSLLVLDNLVTGFADEGLYYSSSYGLVAWNSIVDNNGVGAYFSGLGCLLFANAFSNNQGGDLDGYDPKEQLKTPVLVSYTYGGNRYHNQLGNYYGSYTGLDDGSTGGLAGDGLGDTELPYMALAEGDTHPLVSDPDEYDVELWLLSSDGALWSPDVAPGEAWDWVTIPAGEARVFATPEVAAGAFVLPPAASLEESFSVLVSFAVLQIDSPITATVGWADDQGNSHFEEGAPTVTLTKDDNYQIRVSGHLSSGLLVVPPGKHLALQVASVGSKDFTLVPEQSFLSPPGPAGPVFPDGGQQPALLEVQPPAIDLGEVLFGQPQAFSVTVSNNGPGPLTLSDIAVVGPDAAVLEITDYGCPWPGPLVLAADESCTLSLAFTPPTGGPKSAGLVISSDDPESPYFYFDVTAVAGPQYLLQVALEGATDGGSVSGSGVNCPAQCEVVADEGSIFELTANPAADHEFVAWQGCDQVDGVLCTVTLTADTTVTASFAHLAPELVVEPASLTFDQTWVGDASPVQSVTLSNLGEWPATLVDIALVGEAALDFEIHQTTCGETLEPAASCAVDLRFIPTADGERKATLSVVSDDPEMPYQEVSLTGSAQLKPRTLTVQILPAGGGSALGDGIACPGDCEETFPGPTQVTLEATTNDGYKYIQWTGCDQVQGTTCTVNMDDDRSVAAVFKKLSPIAAVSPDYVDFGQIPVASASAPQAVTVTNTGTGPLLLGEPQITGVHRDEFSVTSDDCSGSELAPGGDCVLELVFSPNGPSLRGATLAVGTSDMLHAQLAVGLLGQGLADPVEPPPPTGTTGAPRLWLAPSSLNFGQQGLWQGAGHQPVRVYNVGGGEVAIADIVIEGKDAAHFDIEDSSCSGALLGPGEGCGANIFFLPSSDGEKRAHAVFQVDSGILESPVVPLYGVGGTYKPSGSNDAKQTSGCRAGTTASGQSVLLLLGLLLGLLVLLRLQACRRPLQNLLRRTLATLSLLFVLVLLPGTVAVATLGCDANPTGACLGSFNLTGQGIFAPVNDTFRFMLMATNLTTSCQETQFTMLEDVQSGGYIGSEYFAIGFYATSPIFEGRRFERGTRISVTQRGMLAPSLCYLTDGYIEVGPAHLFESPEACVATLGLTFAIEGIVCDIGTPGFQLLEEPGLGSANKLHGTGTFSYGAVPEECLPPYIADVSQGDGSYLMGDHLLPPSKSDPRELDLPVEYWGTEVNEIQADHLFVTTRSEEGNVDQSETLTIAVTPTTLARGNRLCECPEYANQTQFRCPDVATSLMQPFEVAATRDGAEPIALTLCDHFGVQPTIVANWDTGPGGPDILAPTAGSEVLADDPLTLEWLAQPDFGDGDIIVRGRIGESDPLFEFANPDSGQLVLDAAFLQGAADAGELTLEVERQAVVTPEFSVPFKVGSSVLVRKMGRVTVDVVPGSTIDFPDPDAVAPGWSEPEAIGEMNLDGWSTPGPEIAAGPDGLIHVAWIHGLQPDYAAFDSQTFNWLDTETLASYEINVGPLVLSAASGQALLAGLQKELNVSSYLPAVYRVAPGADPEGGLLGNASAHEKNWFFGGAMMTDGLLVAGWTNSDEMLYCSFDAGPLELVPPGYSAPWSGPYLFPRDDGRAMLYVNGTTNRFLVVDPAMTGQVEEVYLGAGAAGDDICLDAATIDSQGRFHTVCLDNGRTVPVPMHTVISPVDGEVLTAPTPVTDDPRPCDLHEGHEIAAGSDGSVWLLWQAACPYGICPMLYRLEPDGQWTGPYLGGPARGHMNLAVDGAGRVHMVYTHERPEKGKSGQVPLFHTMMEVAP